MSLDPNLQDVADGYLANRATLPMALVRCIQTTYRRCQDEARKASDLRSHNYDGPLRQDAREVEAIIHDAKYHVLCEMLGDQSRLLTLGFLSERPECGCPEVYAKLDHEAMGASIAPPKGEDYPTICQNPDCPGDRPVHPEFGNCPRCKSGVLEERFDGCLNGWHDQRLWYHESPRPTQAIAHIKAGGRIEQRWDGGWENAIWDLAAWERNLHVECGINGFRLVNPTTETLEA